LSPYLLPFAINGLLLSLLVRFVVYFLHFFTWLQIAFVILIEFQMWKKTKFRNRHNMEIVYTTFPSLLTGVFVGATLWMSTIVLRPDPIQNLDFKFWPDYRVLTRSPDRSGELFKKKSKRHPFSKKTKKSTSCNQVLPGRRVNPPGFPFLYFFFNPTGFQLRIPGQPAKPGRISKLWYLLLVWC
jgi:hypothetical protein